MATAEVRLFAGNERCADRVDGRHRQTEADGSVASIVGRWVDVRICGLRALTFDMRGGRQLAKPDVGRPLDGRVRALFAHDVSLA